jgi:hypothetical protein
MDMIIVYMMNGWNGQEMERSRLCFLLGAKWTEISAFCP